jgi:nitrogen fixation-related uncharacterized protein
MDILFLLIPMSAVLVPGHAGQFDDLDLEAGRALIEETGALDEGQGAAGASPQQS